jgi:sulfopyruvate decarboxylase TPP-binding subunit
MTITEHSLAASAILDELGACRITHFVTMPDYVQFSLYNRLADGYLPRVRVVSCATEDEAVAIALGLHVGGAVPYLSMQNQGVFACANALLSVGVNSRTPVPILVGQWGRELENRGEDPTRSRRLVVRRLEPLLDALEIPYFRLERPADVSVVSRAFRVAHEQERPAAVLVGAHTTWD